MKNDIIVLQSTTHNERINIAEFAKESLIMLTFLKLLAKFWMALTEP